MISCYSVDVRCITLDKNSELTDDAEFNYHVLRREILTSVGVDLEKARGN